MLRPPVMEFCDDNWPISKSGQCLLRAPHSLTRGHQLITITSRLRRQYGGSVKRGFLP